ncbi:MAG: undecaprenyl/decaprenyl-phosphate alpha-N-acetylglucosaminyl 1-phosphate transferase [Deltaproteobacteria bacterium]|nr:undecaprenyl/decaprenyl-phosphate alpha-N-acetylglucosaminyl 1-phosphate transferase [Deltaproteobacteria bacterium]
MVKMHSLYIFMLALFTALIIVPFLQRWALDTGAMDVPDERKLHDKAVPRIGGVAIGMAWLFSLLVYVDMTREVRGILAGSLVVFCIGLIDDLYGLTPKRKFLGQIIATLVTMAVGKIHIHNLGDLFGSGVLTIPEWLAIPFTVIAVVGVVNAFNLMDGLDGLAGGISSIALAAFFILGYLTGNYHLVAMCAALFGAVLGFLKYNLYPARIFMGDTGSLMVGFIIAFLAIGLTQGPGSGIQPIIPVLILGLPIADTFRVMGRRLLKRKSPFSPDRTHVHHRFLDLGLQHRFTVIIIYGVSLFWASLAILGNGWSEPLLLTAYGAGTFVFYLTIHFLRDNRDKLPFMKKDSPLSIRNTQIYLRLSRLAVRTAPVILLLTLLYLFLAAVFCADADTMSTQVGVVLFGGSAALLFITRDAKNHFVQAMLAVAILHITFVLNRHDGQQLIHGISLESLEDVILIALCALVALRLTFRNPTESIFSSIDYLIIGIGLFFIVVAPSISGNAELPDTIFKGLILYLALKVSVLRGRMPARVMLSSVLGVLVTIIVRGLYF